MVRCASLLGLIVVSFLASSRVSAQTNQPPPAGCLPSRRRPTTGRLPAAGLRAARLPAAGLRAAGLSPARRLRAPHLGGSAAPAAGAPAARLLADDLADSPVPARRGADRRGARARQGRRRADRRRREVHRTRTSAASPPPSTRRAAQVRVYVIGDFRHGMQLGGEVLYLHLNDDRIAISGEGLAVGPFLGYKIMIDAGFTFDCPARLRAHQRARAGERARRPTTSRSSRF